MPQDRICQEDKIHKMGKTLRTGPVAAAGNGMRDSLSITSWMEVTFRYILTSQD